MCCSVLHYIAVCCSVLPCIAACCSALHRFFLKRKYSSLRVITRRDQEKIFFAHKCSVLNIKKFSSTLHICFLNMCTYVFTIFIHMPLSTLYISKCLLPKTKLSFCYITVLPSSISCCACTHTQTHTRTQQHTYRNTRIENTRPCVL